MHPLALSYKRHRFPPQIIAHAVWLYARFNLSLREVETEQILTPRTVVHMLQESLTVSQALDDPRTRQFTRIPIFGTGIDDIKGQVIRADLFEAERNGRREAPLSEVANPLVRVSEKLPVQQLLDLFIKQKAHLFKILSSTS